MSNLNPASTAGGSTSRSTDSQLAEALRLMRRALSLIDEANGPGDIGAHLDLAIVRLNDWIERSKSKI